MDATPKGKRSISSLFACLSRTNQNENNDKGQEAADADTKDLQQGKLEEKSIFQQITSNVDNLK